MCKLHQALWIQRYKNLKCTLDDQDHTVPAIAPNLQQKTPIRLPLHSTELNATKSGTIVFFQKFRQSTVGHQMGDGVHGDDHPTLVQVVFIDEIIGAIDAPKIFSFCIICP